MYRNALGLVNVPDGIFLRAPLPDPASGQPLPPILTTLPIASPDPVAIVVSSSPPPATAAPLGWGKLLLGLFGLYALYRVTR